MTKTGASVKGEEIGNKRSWSNHKHRQKNETKGSLLEVIKRLNELMSAGGWVETVRDTLRSDIPSGVGYKAVQRTVELE